MSEVKAGQVWRRKKDGALMRVVSVDTLWDTVKLYPVLGGAAVWAEGRRLLHSYELVTDA